MSKIYDAQLPNEQAQMHALIIGVGHYPHLPGGEKSGSEPAPKNFGLQQLTFPVASAKALTDWLLTAHYNPAAPLGSIELLLSPATYIPSNNAASRLQSTQGTSISVEAAEFDRIKKATARWYQRVNQHRDNVAFFYFCGHGLEASDRYLLPADFGANPLDWTDNLINFTVTHLNMQWCNAKTQCFFLDACRDRPSELQAAAATGKVGQVMVGPQTRSILDRDAPIFHAAAPGRSAAGASGQTSYFTKALIDCLNGMGSRQPTSAYAPIDHISLGTALRELVDRLAKETSLKLRCAVSGESLLPLAVDLHHAPFPVQVLASIRCKPLSAHKIALLSVTDVAGHCESRKTLDEDPWELTITAGKCALKAEFDGVDPYEDIEQQDIAFPPLFRPIIDIPSRP